MLSNITKENLDKYFKELAKVYKKLTHGYEIELVLIGGASILINYNFRDVTNDIDAYYLPSYEIKEAIKKVSEKYDISPSWLNDNFKETTSFSKKLSEFSTFYKSYYEVLTIRTIKDEYLIAMKLASGRKYKNDMSDIIGILYECKKQGKNITYEMINDAVIKLYDNWDNISKEAIDFLNLALHTDNLEELYNKIRSDEKNIHSSIVDFDKKYPDTLNKANINDIIKMLNKNRYR